MNVMLSKPCRFRVLGDWVGLLLHHEGFDNNRDLSFSFSSSSYLCFLNTVWHSSVGCIGCGMGGGLWRGICAEPGRWLHCYNPKDEESGVFGRTDKEFFQSNGAGQSGSHH